MVSKFFCHRSAPSSTFTSSSPLLPPVVTVSPTTYRQAFSPNNQRAKRVPGQANDVDLDELLLQVNPGANLINIQRLGLRLRLKKPLLAKSNSHF